MESLSASLCRSCRQRIHSSLPPTRSFSNTTHRRVVPPESPNYISIPISRQPGFHFLNREKGYLPKPRNIFPRNGPDKTSPEYLARLTSDPKPSNVSNIPDSQLTPQQLYKRRMTALRKSHLQTGLTDLHARAQSEAHAQSVRGATKTAERMRLIAQPPREDDRLTSTSIPSSMSPALNRLTLTPRQQTSILRRKRRNLSKHQTKKTTTQHTALHTLYMSARSFITSEPALLQKIEEEFTDKTFGAYTTPPARNYWEAQGAPDGIAQMVKRSTVGRGQPSASEREDAWKRDQERMKRLAEELSGGKM